MKLTKVHINNYRSIVDSEPVEIEDVLTVVVGRNEQGKTNFLKALLSINTDQFYSPSDLPNHLRPSLEERKPADVKIISAWFALEAGDRDKLTSLIPELEKVSSVRVTKFYDNHYEWAVIKSELSSLVELLQQHSSGPTTEFEEALMPRQVDLSEQLAASRSAIEALRVKYHAHASRLPSFGANIETADLLVSSFLETRVSDPATFADAIKTFVAAFNGLPALDELILDDLTETVKELDKIKAVMKAKQEAHAQNSIETHLPRFILHSAKSDHIPNSISVSDFVADAETVSKGMSNLCRAAGLSIQKIKELAATADPSQRETYEDYYNGTISGGLNEFWTQKVYRVHFRIEQQRLSVSISDGTYQQRVQPSDRSEGFQWYLSFYAALLNEVGTHSESILLLDNPGLELHLDGQKDIKRFLEEKIGLTSQVIYVTHSPAMVDPFSLHQVRTVELHEDQVGTKISRFVAGRDGSDILEPIRASIGMNLVSSLMLNDWNVLLEGAADRPTVEGIFFSHYPEHRAKIIVNGSIAENTTLVSIYRRSGLPFVVLLDADSSGRHLKGDLVRVGIPESHILVLDEVFTEMGRDFELEDILSAEFYHSAVLSTYSKQPVDMPTDQPKKRTKLYEDLFKKQHGIGFSKKRVAETIKTRLKDRQEDNDTHARLGILATAIIEKLQPAKAPAADVLVASGAAQAQE